MVIFITFCTCSQGRKNTSATKLKSFHFWLISGALILEIHPIKHIKLPVGRFAVCRFISAISCRGLFSFSPARSTARCRNAVELQFHLPRPPPTAPWLRCLRERRPFRVSFIPSLTTHWLLQAAPAQEGDQSRLEYTTCCKILETVDEKGEGFASACFFWSKNAILAWKLSSGGNDGWKHNISESFLWHWSNHLRPQRDTPEGTFNEKQATEGPFKGRLQLWIQKSFYIELRQMSGIIIM